MSTWSLLLHTHTHTHYVFRASLCQDGASVLQIFCYVILKTFLLRYYYHHFTEEGTERGVRNFQKVTQLVKSRIKMWAKPTPTHLATLASMQGGNRIHGETFGKCMSYFPGKSHSWCTVFQCPGFTVSTPSKAFLKPIFFYCLDTIPL